MKSRLIISLTALFFFNNLNAQEEIKVKIGGFVRYEAFFDTYKSLDAREGEIFLYPKAAQLDDNGDDVNKRLQLEMLSVMSRFNIKTQGPTVFNAKTSSVIEADFFATANDYVRLIRMRHAFLKFNWEKFELLMGQSWHPMFVTQCFPNTVTIAVGTPFSTLNRSPQIKGTYTLSPSVKVVGAFLSHGYHRSAGPADAQRNSGLPDSQFQLQYSKGSVFSGFTAGYKFLTPRLTTAQGFKTTETIGSYNLQAFFKYASSKFSFKASTVYGENLTNFIMLGGYGAKDDPTLVDDYEYSNMKTYSVWTDITFNDNPQVGIFAGYTENLGGSDTYFPIGYARSDNLANTYRISPRLTIVKQNIKIGIEYLLAGAVYGTEFDENYKATVKADPTFNNRFIFAIVYSF